MIYWQLFIAFLKIGLLGFGGGMSVIALTELEVVAHGWATEAEFVDIVAISQVTPGPIGLNCATYVGYTASGTVLGSLIASLGIILPSVVIMLIICSIYLRIRDKWADNRVFQVVMRIIRILVLCLIAYAAYRLCTPDSFIDTRSYVICAVVAVCTLLPMVLDLAKVQNKQIKKAAEILSHPILLIVACAAVGAFIY